MSVTVAVLSLSQVLGFRSKVLSVRVQVLGDYAMGVTKWHIVHSKILRSGKGHAGLQLEFMRFCRIAEIMA